MPVSVRTRLPTRNAWWKSRWTSFPADPAAQGILDLPEDLALSDDRGIHPGRNAKQVVSSRTTVSTLEEVKVRPGAISPHSLVEDVQKLGRIGGVISHEIELDAVARRDDCRFAYGG